MPRRTEYTITPELKASVIRCYTEKNMSLDIIGKLVCPRYIAEKIIKDSGIPLKMKGQGLRDDTRFEYRARHSSYNKLS